MQGKKVGFIGAGNMARSIISGLVESGYSAADIVVSNRSIDKLMALQEELGVNITTDNDAVLAFSDIIVLAVKPQIMADVLAQLDDTLVDDSKVFMSIAAGIKLARLGTMLPAAKRWVRAMPNTPSSVGKGMTGLIATDNVSAEDQNACGELMAAVGEILWVREETKIDGVIAAAGSAPAYFFLFLEAMQSEAENMGFSHEDARLLVQQAMLGAAHMVVANPDTELSTLRENVTSKGGTTAQALATFTAGELPALVSKAMQAAVQRAEQMSNEF
ncbi:pyrroline-5-carboxylate reductase [Alteromonas sp. ASW11-36]|uniref:Pyrroline-5-carboxylate reductase n=1 Tax=Alteromonas arenosi TaxID=3055817 RepID=A0ABT7STH0_9ALTE|nr:pyrroline-5-carboxylate reductase [Alteromonas sp. ASW11-36]MDM7859498.1 pyrroline-5-carboxylate reductase [Alteromonas sp. ASW11-36]